MLLFKVANALVRIGRVQKREEGAVILKEAGACTEQKRERPSY